MVQTHFSTTQGQADSQGALGDRCGHGLGVGASNLIRLTLKPMTLEVAERLAL
jgi:hypothetical protein